MGLFVIGLAVGIIAGIIGAVVLLAYILGVFTMKDFLKRNQGYLTGCFFGGIAVVVGSAAFSAGIIPGLIITALLLLAAHIFWRA